MVDFLKEISGLFPALLIVVCQWGLGCWLDRKKALSPISQWVLGLSVLAFLNFAFLALGQGFLIHLNLLALFFVPFFLKQAPWRNFSRFYLLLSGFFVFLFLSNVTNPIVNWDAQCVYLHNAKHWSEVGWLDPEGLLHHYARRPQLVSVIYAWCLMWGNEVTCQVLDLFFFCGIVAWLGKQLGLSQIKLLGAVLVAATCAHYDPPFFGFVANGGNDFFTALLMIVSYEVLVSEKRSLFLWVLISAALLNSRWPGFAIFFLLVGMAKFYYRRSVKEVIHYAIAPFFLAGGWFLWNVVVHHNPVYPCLQNMFSSVPTNSLLFSDWGELSEEFDRGMRGIREWGQLKIYLVYIGPILLCHLIGFFLKFDNKKKSLFVFTIASTVLTALITFQGRFQYLNALLIATLCFSSRSPMRAINIARVLLLFSLTVYSYRPVMDRAQSIWRFVADQRHGFQYVLENRIRLYPAAHWLQKNLNENEKKEIVLWPMSPFYYCPNPALRADDAAYFLPENILDDPKAISSYYKQIGVRWIVQAPPMYFSEYEKGPRFTEKQVRWMLENDKEWQLIVNLPAKGVSPETSIYRLTN